MLDRSICNHENTEVFLTNNTNSGMSLCLTYVRQHTMQPILIRALPSSNSTLIALNNITCISIVYDLTIYRVRTIQIQETNVMFEDFFVFLILFVKNIHLICLVHTSLTGSNWKYLFYS